MNEPTESPNGQTTERPRGATREIEPCKAPDHNPYFRRADGVGPEDLDEQPDTSVTPTLGKSSEPVAETRYEPHDLSLLFPEMGKSDFADLKGSIKEAGRLHEPIRLHEGKILDGRHRFRACEELGIEPEFAEWSGPGSPEQYVLARNLSRRHLSSSQRAMVVAGVANRTKGRPAENAQNQAVHQEELAKRYGISRATIQAGLRVRDNGTPDLVRETLEGRIPVSRAAKIAGQPVDKQPESLEQYRTAKCKKTMENKTGVTGKRRDNKPGPREASDPAGFLPQADAPERETEGGEEVVELSKYRPSVVEGQILKEPGPVEPVSSCPKGVEVHAYAETDRFIGFCNGVIESMPVVLIGLDRGLDQATFSVLKGIVRRTQANLHKISEAIGRTESSRKLEAEENPEYSPAR